MLRLTLRNGDIVLLRGSLEDMNLNAQRHLDNGLGQIHRLDNARVLKNAGFGKRTQSKKKNKDTLQEWHDSLWKRVASDEAKRKGKIAPILGASRHVLTFQANEDFAHRFGHTDDRPLLRCCGGA